MSLPDYVQEAVRAKVLADRDAVEALLREIGEAAGVSHMKVRDIIQSKEN